MDKTADSHVTRQLQLVDPGEQLSRVERELMLAAGARHRSRLLNDDGARLEDLAVEWIELLRASTCRTTG
jgi:hypothetical protein